MVDTENRLNFRYLYAGSIQNNLVLINNDYNKRRNYF